MSLCVSAPVMGQLGGKQPRATLGGTCTSRAFASGMCDMFRAHLCMHPQRLRRASAAACVGPEDPVEHICLRCHFHPVCLYTHTHTHSHTLTHTPLTHTLTDAPIPHTQSHTHTHPSHTHNHTRTRTHPPLSSRRTNDESQVPPQPTRAPRSRQRLSGLPGWCVCVCV